MFTSLTMSSTVTVPDPLHAPAQGGNVGVGVGEGVAVCIGFGVAVLVNVIVGLVVLVGVVVGVNVAQLLPATQAALKTGTHPGLQTPSFGA